jgi:hypothetical protein
MTRKDILEILKDVDKTITIDDIDCVEREIDIPNKVINSTISKIQNEINKGVEVKVSLNSDKFDDINRQIDKIKEEDPSAYDFRVSTGWDNRITYLGSPTKDKIIKFFDVHIKEYKRKHQDDIYAIRRIIKNRPDMVKHIINLNREGKLKRILK